MNRRDVISLLPGALATASLASLPGAAQAQGYPFRVERVEGVMRQLRARAESIPDAMMGALRSFCGDAAERAAPILALAERLKEPIARGLGALYLISEIGELPAEDQLYPGVQDMTVGACVGLGGALCALREGLSALPGELLEAVTLACRRHPELPTGVCRHLEAELIAPGLAPRAAGRLRQMLRRAGRLLQRKPLAQLLQLVEAEIEQLVARARHVAEVEPEALALHLSRPDEAAAARFAQIAAAWEEAGVDTGACGALPERDASAWPYIGLTAGVLLIIAILLFPGVFLAIGQGLLIALIIITCPIWLPIAVLASTTEGLAILGIVIALVALIIAIAAAIAGSSPAAQEPA